MEKPFEGSFGFFSAPGRNRTADTRIFKYPPIDRYWPFSAGQEPQKALF